MGAMAEAKKAFDEATALPRAVTGRIGASLRGFVAGSEPGPATTPAPGAPPGGRLATAIPQRSAVAAATSANRAARLECRPKNNAGAMPRVKADRLGGYGLAQ